MRSLALNICIALATVLASGAPASQEAEKADYVAAWMWGDADAGFGNDVAQMNPLRWSELKNLKLTIANLQKETESVCKNRPVHMHIKVQHTGKVLLDHVAASPAEAIGLLAKWDSNSAAAAEEAEAQLEAQGYAVKWMYGDANAGLGHNAARLDPLNVRWSSWLTREQAIAEINSSGRPVRLKVNEGITSKSKIIETVSLATAIDEIKNMKPAEVVVSWMWGDASVFGKDSSLGQQLAQVNFARWSRFKTTEETIADLEVEKLKEAKRPIDIVVRQAADDWVVVDRPRLDRDAAIQEIAKWAPPPWAPPPFT